MTAPQWTPLTDPTPSPLDGLRAAGSAQQWARAYRSLATHPAATQEIHDRAAFYQAEADAMDVAAKVDSEWLCRVCGGTSRTCECEA